MSGFAPKLGLKPGLSVHGRLRLARLLELREEDMARLARDMEAHPLFEGLRRAGVIRRRPFSAATFAARRWAGWSLARDSGGLGELLDSSSDAVRLLRRVGQRRFEACFLREEGGSDAELGKRCGLSLPEAASVRALVDRLYIQEEFEPRPEAAQAVVFSAVAGIAIERDRPVLRFFHRDVWKGEFAVDEARLKAALAAACPEEAPRIQRFLSRLSFLARRQTTLYKALQAVLAAQAQWLRTGDPLRRQPLTQRSLAAAVGVDPSVVNRLIGNKCVELPWGTEAPLAAFVPSAKELARARLEALARERSELSDQGLRAELAARHQIHLSRRSIAQYRQDLGLGPRGRRS